MPLGDRIRHRKRRLVRSGEQFDSGELEHGDVELELPAPSPEPPADDQVEPWGWRDKPAPDSVRERLREYQRFLEQWREEHHDDPVGAPDEEPAGAE